MAKVEGAERLNKKLEELKKKLSVTVSVLVGFTQSYAVYVHENLEAHHPVGQAKFLEQPFRELQGELKGMIKTGMQKGIGVEKSLLLAGLRLQREAQLLTPVDTGALRASAFTRVEHARPGS